MNGDKKILRDKLRRRDFQMALGMVEEGYSATDISKDLGYGSVSSVSLLFREYGTSYNKLRERALKKNLEGVSKGRGHVFEVRLRFELSPKTIYNKAYELGESQVFEHERRPRGASLVRLAESLVLDGNERIDTLIAQGILSIKKIALEVEMSKQGVGYIPDRFLCKNL
ncbi:MAG: hypothetical protein AABX85_01405 [Nanoarchaeota archaeon]